MKIRIRRKELIYYFVCVVILLVSYNYCDLHDYQVYYLEYNNVAISNQLAVNSPFEYGFALIENIFIKCGADFKTFYGIYILLCMCLYINFLRKANNRYFVLLLFIFSPYLNCLQQIRSFLASAIVLNSLSLLQSNRLIDTLKYVAIVILCTFFHSTSVIFLVFILIKYFSVSKLLKITFIMLTLVPIVSTIYYGYVYNALIGYELFSRITYLLKGSSYIQFASKMYLAIFIIMYIILLLIFYNTRKLKKCSDKTIYYYKLSLVIIILSTLVCISNAGYRISLLLVPLVYLLFDSMIKEDKSNKSFYIVCVVVFALATFLIFYNPLIEKTWNILINEMWRVRDVFK